MFQRFLRQSQTAEVSLTSIKPELIALSLMKGWAARNVNESNGRLVIDSMIVRCGGTQKSGPPSAWCSYCVCTALLTAGDLSQKTLSLKVSGGVAKLWNRNPSNQIAIDIIRDIYKREGRLDIKPGDLILRARDEDDADQMGRGAIVLGHVAMLTGEFLVLDTHVYLGTVEGNTNAAGSRDGDCVALRTGYDGWDLSDPRIVGIIRPSFS